MSNKQLILKSRPKTYPEPSNFELVDQNLNELKDNQVKVQIQCISLDPAMRGWIEDQESYIEPVKIGSVMRAFAAGVVEESKSKDFKKGDSVVGLLGVRDYAIADSKDIYKVDPDVAPLETWVGGLGMPGLTAYFGMTEIANMKKGETIVVSAASGAVGQVVGQLAKNQGARVIGIAGGKEKCDLIKKEFGFDESIDYKNSKVSEELDQLCPDGFDVYWESVGGPIANAAIARVKTHGRVVLCGMISNYNEPDEMGLSLEAYGNLLKNRIQLQGFVILDYMDRSEEGIKELSKLKKQGNLTFKDDVRQVGLDKFTETLNDLYSGDNKGKLVMKIH